ncbi:hypothetical protein BATDEDRAFT_86426 [Batrachochytrium dendrobatidis JAM81]|uniref:Uncharacterized protein n=2 Tax=Batrachochytrium dendrobatidis TaxID=109871 RepID=F4NWC8_BATDJ|nr:uncharacterized protein BATDEDRAFT_86426 [Batrachochytrium dendrobatidis JAM81]EGF82808.1 hypothetical protein BATDEDRAFT_86426 [Batrachochytrium dendrobatidis JAM81]OAJ39601.1 hypothetical protein BDEG_23432 [Batrachochytrium dendrobatidis JEL423]|eukprot:XP_006677062.1 hypothetical protein BATDEDRAFT_86426 [Batrachochytrium dendrobatidis JAM81]
MIPIDAWTNLLEKVADIAKDVQTVSDADRTALWSVYSDLRRQLVRLKLDLLGNEQTQQQQERMQEQYAISVKDNALLTFNEFIGKWKPILEQLENHNIQILHDSSFVTTSAQDYADTARSARHGLNLETFDAELMDLAQMDSLSKSKPESESEPNPDPESDPAGHVLVEESTQMVIDSDDVLDLPNDTEAANDMVLDQQKASLDSSSDSRLHESTTSALQQTTSEVELSEEEPEDLGLGSQFEFL